MLLLAKESIFKVEKVSFGVLRCEFNAFPSLKKTPYVINPLRVATTSFLFAIRKLAIESF